MRRKSLVHPSQAPCGIKTRKGVNAAALSSAFVDFALSNPFALHLYNWLVTSSNPEEHFISTLATLTVKKSEKAGEWKVLQRFDVGTMQFTGTMVTDSSW